MIKIYILIDPITNEIRYIGRTKLSLKERLEDHIKQSFRRNTHKCAWIRQIVKKGKQPIIEQIDEVLEKEKDFWEYHYISLYRSWGFSLTNTILDPNEWSRYIQRKVSTENRKKSYKTTKVILENITTGERLPFNSQKDAAEYLGVKPKRVSAVFNTKKKKRVYKPTGHINYTF